MPNITLLFALLTGLTAGFYAIFQKLAASNITYALGAAIISGTAFIVNVFILLFIKQQGVKVIFTTKGLIFLIFAGISAACIDLFTLLTFSKGLKLSSSFIITGVQTTLILIAGFMFLREPLNTGRIIGITLIVIGIFILQKYGI